MFLRWMVLISTVVALSAFIGCGGNGAQPTPPPPPTTGTLTINITGLPTGTPANITVTGPGALSQTITTNTTLPNLPLGAYTVAATPVQAGTSVYHPATASQAVNVASSSPVSINVDYNGIVPTSTKVLDAVGMQSLSISSDSTTIGISTMSDVAVHLQPGDVLVSAPAAAVPTGLAFKVASVTNTGSEILITGVPATLADIFTQATIHLAQGVDPNQINAAPLVAHFKQKGIKITGLPADRASLSAQGLGDSCANQSTIQVDIPDSDIAENPANPFEKVTIGGSLEFCPSFALDVDYSFFHLKSASASLTLGQHARLDFFDGFALSLDKTQQLASFPAGTYVFPVLDVPVAVTPVITISVGIKGDAMAGISSSLEEDASGTIALSYTAGQDPVLTTTFNSPVFSPLQPLQIGGTASARAFTVVQVDFHFYQFDVLGTNLNPVDVSPHVELSPFVDWEADTLRNPWWTLTGGVDGEVGLSIKIFDQSLADPTKSGTLFVVNIANSGGPFVPSAPVITDISPKPIVASSQAQTISMVGSGFNTNATAVLCSGGLCSSPQITSAATSQLNANAVLTAGNWTAQATNSGGAVSNLFPFIVSPSNSPVTLSGTDPSVVIARPVDQKITFSGSGLQNGLSLRLCLNICFPPLSGSQIESVASDGSSVTVLAKLGQAGRWTVSAINPDRHESQPFGFVVDAPISASVNPGSGIVNQTQFLITGAGASANGNVDATSTWPDGSLHKFSAIADSQGKFTFGPFAQTVVGLFSEIYTDRVTGATTPKPLTYTVTPASTGVAVSKIDPPTPVAAASSQPLTLNGSGFVSGSIAEFTSNGMTITVSGAQVNVLPPNQLQLSVPLASAGVWQVQILNPGGIQSAPFKFPVAASPGSTLTGSLSPPTPTVGVINTSIVGTATAGATVTETETRPDGTVHGPFSTTANASGNYSLGPFILQELGTYSGILHDSISGVSTPITYAGTGDFSTSVNSSSQTVTQGQSASYTVTFTSISGYSGTVVPAALNWSPQIPGATASWSQQSVTVPSNGSVTDTFTLNTAPSTPPGTYSTITLQGTNGSVSHAAPSAVSLTVTPSGGTITATLSPNNPTVGVTQVNISGTASAAATVTDTSTFPDGTVHNFSVTADGAGSYTDGPFVLQQLGTFHDVLRDGKTGASTSLSYSGLGDFSSSVNTTNQTVTQGQSASYIMTFSSSAGFSGTIVPAALNWSPQIPGATASWSLPSVKVPSNGSVTDTFTITTAASTPAGNYSKIVLQGTNGSVTHPTASPVNLAVTGSGGGITATISPQNPTVGVTQVSITGNASAGAAVTDTSTFPDGTVHNFAVTANSNGSYVDGPFVLHQLGTFNDVLRDGTTGTSTSISYSGIGDFSASVDATSQTVSHGQSATYTVTFTSISGFSGTVVPAALNWSPQIPGATASWSQQFVTVPSNSSITDTFTINTAPSTPPGTYSNIVLQGANGSVTHTTPSLVSLTVQ